LKFYNHKCKQNIRFFKYVTQNVEDGSWKMEVGSWKLEVGLPQFS